MKKDKTTYENIKEEPYYINIKKGEKVLLSDAIAKEDIYQKNNVKIITLIGLQKIAEKEEIVEKRFRTEIVPNATNEQQHAVNIWLGFKGDAEEDNWVRGSGEANRLNTGELKSTTKGIVYQERNKVDSCYRFAMAEKRAFSRALLKLVKLYGFHGDAEAQDFAKTGDDSKDLDY